MHRSIDRYLASHYVLAVDIKRAPNRLRSIEQSRFVELHAA